MPERPPTGISGKGHPPYEEEFRVIGEILQRDAEQIMERWFERASDEQVHADADHREEAMNELLHMLEALGQRLQEQSSDALEQSSDIAREHGQQRSGVGWDIVDLVRDYEILHGVVLEHLGGTLNERLTYRQAMVLAMVIDGAIGQAVAVFGQMAQQQLQEQVARQQDELRRLTLDLTDAEHHQRQQIAKTLHDDFQQLLVAMRMKLQAVRKAPGSDAVDEVDRMLGQVLEIARNVTTDLHPMVLEQRGLPEAVEWLAETFQQRYDLTVTVDLQVADGTDFGPMSLRRLVFEAIRELLFNVVKHARTDRAWINICCDDESPWKIVIEDHGVGSVDMAEAAAPPEHSFGLGSLRYRIEQVNGTMKVQSQPGEGTRVVLTVPLESA